MLRKVEGVGEAHIVRGDPRLKETDMDAWYGELLTEVYPAKARPYLYGADAGLCARRNVLLEHNTWIAGEKSATANAYMVIGVALEKMLVDALERAGKLIAWQLRLPRMAEVWVSGYVDIVHYDSEGDVALTEVKSCGKLPSEIHATHLAQVQLYSAVTGIDKVWVSYISRNVREEFGSKLAMRTFPVDTREEALRPRLETAAASRIASDSRRLPPVPAHFRKHTECHYCEFRDAFCWKSRPGLGGADPQPPMLELEPLAMIRLEREAGRLAASMWSNREVRQRELFKELGLRG